MTSRLPRLKTDATLVDSEVVANASMNRERVLQGTNSYEKELRFNIVDWLSTRRHAQGKVAWLDLCCGQGHALIQASHLLKSTAAQGTVLLEGIDLVPLFADHDPSAVTLHSADLHRWSPVQPYDLITCVHGLHYIGDKLHLIQQALSWLQPTGVFIAHLDVATIRIQSHPDSTRMVSRELRRWGLIVDRQKHLIRREGAFQVTSSLTYLGADDQAGPNATLQPGVHSWYR